MTSEMIRCWISQAPLKILIRRASRQNITDRIAKAVRRKLYLRDQSRPAIAAALDRLLQRRPPPSPSRRWSRFERNTIKR
jgi:hypothetical protein